MKLSVALRLGRISNIPTVWSNTLAGVVIAGGEAWRVTTLLTAIGISLLYISGMYLNDAFDSDFDARERPERPIPAGLASQSTVFATGFGLMLVGLGFILWASSAGVLKDSWRPVLLSLLLAATVLFYNWHHKGNPISPIVMGLCRALIYVVAGYTVAETPSPDVFIIAFTTFCYLIGLTFAAKQETLIRFDSLWPLALLAAPLIYGLFVIAGGGVLSLLVFAALIILIAVSLHFLRRRMKGGIGKAIVCLIAGISLADALYLSSASSSATAAALICFVATLAMQRWIKGT
ncbi:MAG: UbiA family prenyltransferase [Rhodomicrobium sp.]